MKKILKKIVASILFVVILLNISGFKIPDNNAISLQSAEIVAKSMFAQLTGKNQLEEFIVTPLYDTNGIITYYCYDFFNGNQPIGYIVVSANADAELISEYSDKVSSEYLQQQKKNNKNIYYNPFDKYILKENKIINNFGKEIDVKDINKSITKGDKKINKKIIKALEDKNYNIIGKSSHALKSNIEFDEIADNEQQYDFLDQIGGSGNYTSAGYYTLENKMIKNQMLSSCGKMNDIVIEGKNLSNTEHCAITAIANCMLYHRTICCNAFPANIEANDSGYISMMQQIFNIAYIYDYFDAFGSSGMNYLDIPDLAVKTFNSFGYNNADSNISYNLSWNKIDIEISSGERPFVLWFNSHAVSVFAYNRLSGTFNGINKTYNFLKVANGYIKEGIYVSYSHIPTNNSGMATIEPY